MSNFLTDDYFSFMSEKWERKQSTQREGVKPHDRLVSKPVIAPLSAADTIDFAEEPQIEVVESFVSDTMIQRLFKHRSDA